MSRVPGLALSNTPPSPASTSRDVRGIGHHHGDDVRLADRVGDRAGALAARRDQCVDLGLAAVVADDVEPGVRQVAGHRAAHDAQADESNGGH